MTSFISELRRRNVFRVAGVYGVVGWLIAQIAVTAEVALHLPPWFDMIIVVTLLLGFPVALVFAWAFEMTPDGVKRTHQIDPEESIRAITGKKLDIAILFGLFGVAILIFFSMFNTDKNTKDQNASNAVTDLIAEIREQSIAVLPFVDFSAEHDQGYFADGISEELLNVLSRIKGLRVSSRTSAFAFKGQDTSIANIGKALNVAHVVEGSIRKSGDTLRISAQLIDTKTDLQLWSRTYDRPLSVDNLFEIQDEIAAAIVGELRGQLHTEKRTTGSTRPTSLEAYELYLKARELSIQRKPETLQESVEDYKAAIALAPDFALAHAGIGETYLLLSSYAGIKPDMAITMAEPHIDKALTLEPNASETLAAASFLNRRKSDLKLAIDYAQRAVAANPNNSGALLRLGVALNSLGRNTEALDVFIQAKQLDPLSPVLHANVVALQIAQGQLENAEITAKQFLLWNSDNAIAHLVMANVLLGQRKYELAHPVLKETEARNPASSGIQTILSELYLSLGLKEEALAVSRNANKKAITLACSGQYKEAMSMLETLNSRYDKLSVLYCSREFASNIDVFDSVSKGLGWPESIDLNSSFADEFALVTFVLKKANHPDSDTYMEILHTFFKEKSPADFSGSDQLRAGVFYDVLINKPDAALVWVDRMIDLSLLDSILNEPIFDGLRDSPAFKARQARQEIMIAPIRQSIKFDLENPKSNWLQ